MVWPDHAGSLGRVGGAAALRRGVLVVVIAEREEREADPVDPAHSRLPGASSGTVLAGRGAEVRVTGTGPSGVTVLVTQRRPAGRCRNGCRSGPPTRPDARRLARRPKIEPPIWDVLDFPNWLPTSISPASGRCRERCLWSRQRIRFIEAR
jgi:hypothetical protein